MSGTKMTTIKSAIKSFINILDEEDYASLVTFNNVAKILAEPTQDKSVVTTAVNSMYANGLTSIYQGIDKAISLFDSAELNEYKIIIVFTDGYDEPSTTYATHYEEIINKAVENNIIIYTIGISTVDKALLENIAQETGGGYYYASVVTEL